MAIPRRSPNRMAVPDFDPFFIGGAVGFALSTVIVDLNGALSDALAISLILSACILLIMGAVFGSP